MNRIPDAWSAAPNRFDRFEPVSGDPGRRVRNPGAAFTQSHGRDSFERLELLEALNADHDLRLAELREALEPGTVRELPQHMPCACGSRTTAAPRLRWSTRGAAGGSTRSIRSTRGWWRPWCRWGSTILRLPERLKHQGRVKAPASLRTRYFHGPPSARQRPIGDARHSRIRSRAPARLPGREGARQRSPKDSRVHQ